MKPRRQGWARRAGVLALVAVAGGPLPAWAFADKAPAVRWAEPAAAAVKWRGIVSLDSAGGSGAAMMYPAPNLAGFLAAILTHAALASSAQNAEQKRQQEMADAVLAPYAAALQDWPAQALWQAALADPRTPQASPEAGPAWAGEAVPSFSVAPDAGTLVLDLGAKLTPPGGTAVEVVVRVVSMPLNVPDPRAHWVADEARVLKATATALFTQALALAAREAVTRSAQAAAGTGTTGETSADATPYRTHRYFMGSTQRSERAQKLGEGCDRIVMRTLRGWLLSAPTALPAAGGRSLTASATPTPLASLATSASSAAAHSVPEAPAAAADSASAPGSGASAPGPGGSSPADGSASQPAETPTPPPTPAPAPPGPAPAAAPPACDPLYQV